MEIIAVVLGLLLSSFEPTNTTTTEYNTEHGITPEQAQQQEGRDFIICNDQTM